MAYSPQKLISIANLVGEDKDAWKFYLKKGKIKQALSSCRTAKQKAAVNGTHAESLFNSGQYDRAAPFFAQSSLSFETITMKYLKYKQFGGLEKYLIKVLEVYQKSKLPTDNSIQRKVLCTWIVELKLTKINEFKATNNFDIKRNNFNSEQEYEMQIMVMDSQK